mmetsp:Transcript_25244/g.34786  ORF Transcript_25244/g.34786 Transcript_25244/m.34786 type:complete len:88 (+) Transcript_25244:85-348(+)
MTQNEDEDMDHTFGHTIQKSVHVYSLSNYKIGSKPVQGEKYNSLNERLESMRIKYNMEGLRRSVEAIILVTFLSNIFLQYFETFRIN